MPSFSVNASRFDPYKGFRFRVRWDGRTVPNVHRVKGLRWSPPPPWPSSSGPMITLVDQGTASQLRSSIGDAVANVLQRVRKPETARAADFAGGLPRQWSRLMIERGRTHDTSFEDWAAQASEAARTERESARVRKDIVIEVQNEAGQAALAFKVFGCVPVEYEPIGALDANRPAVLTERLVLEYLNAERDRDVFEPAEPSFTEPGT